MKGAYIIGEPAVGKSTVVGKLTAHLGVDARTRPFAHLLYADATGKVLAAQIGGAHESYPGTDRLSMSVQPKAIEWLDSAPAPVVFGEGDRLATVGFLDALAMACDEWWLIKLEASKDTLRTRRAARGSDQDPKWLAGRATKVERLAEAYPGRLVRVDAERAPEAVAEGLRTHPAFAWTATH